MDALKFPNNLLEMDFIVNCITIKETYKFYI